MPKRRTTTVSADTRVFGLYSDFASLRTGVDNLKSLRFAHSDISVLFAEAAVLKSFAPLGPDSLGLRSEPQAFIGGTLRWLTYVRPEGAGIISAALAGFGVAEGEADLYERSLRQGRLLVCVRCSGDKSRAEAIKAISLAGAEQVVAACSSFRGSGEPSADCYEVLVHEQLAGRALVS
jgi:hypothetical protein